MKQLIPIENPTKAFTEHLQLENNHRVLFSGQFGIGKTYFLKNYFEERSDSHLTIYLSPVNYPVASNEDIFQFIKYDIIRELIIRYKLLDALIKDYDDNLKAGNTFTNRATSLLWNFLISSPDFIKAILLATPEISHANINFAALGIASVAVIEGFEKLSKRLQEAKAAREDAAHGDNVKESADFIQATSQKYLYERDPVTVFITEVLQLMSATSGKDKTILIIDDLDRIDPEHIFRLFNVFGAHLSGPNQEENKFGFSTIIFVCDTNNIKSIYSAKYGITTDFNGYIDKFFSKKIFYFDNRMAVKNHLIQSFIDFKVDNENKKAPILEFMRKEGVTDVMSYIIDGMIRSRELTLRSLEKFNTGFVIAQEKTFLLNAITGIGIEVSNSGYTSILIVQLLNQLFSKTDDFIESLDRVANSITNSSDTFLKKGIGRYYFLEILLFTTYREHNFREFNQNTTIPVVVFANKPNYTPQISVTITKRAKNMALIYQLEISDDPEIVLTEKLFFNELKRFASTLKNWGFID